MAKSLRGHGQVRVPRVMLRNFLLISMSTAALVSPTGPSVRAADSAAAIAGLQALSAVLDGNRYHTQTYDRDGVARAEDWIAFRAGKFVSENCGQWGFGESPYWIRMDDGKLHFLAVTESPSHGTILWKGTVTGDRIEATYVWTKERWYWTLRREYRLVGKRVK